MTFFSLLKETPLFCCYFVAQAERMSSPTADPTEKTRKRSIMMFSDSLAFIFHCQASAASRATFFLVVSSFVLFFFLLSLWTM